MLTKIAVVTSTRAEYGLLSPLIGSIRKDPELELQLIVTGTHLSPEFGMTISEIERDGIPVSDKVEILVSSDSGYGSAKSAGLAAIGFADSFRRLRPELLIVLGDRFEILAIVMAAALIGIPVAHLHGGERTDGAVDDWIRHAITKLSHLHFVSTPEYARRVIQLGESPERVFHVGAIGLDRIQPAKLLPKKELAQRLGLPAEPSWCVVSYHPVTLEPSSSERQFQELLEAIAGIPGAHFVFTKANADAGGRAINAMAAQFVEGAKNATLFDSLGSETYLSLMAASAAVIGNSSSGIIEAPYLRVQSIDIGSRQRGRIRGDSVTHVEPVRREITDAIARCLKPGTATGTAASPYYNGGAAPAILRVIKSWVPQRIKSFHDIETGRGAP